MNKLKVFITSIVIIVIVVIGLFVNSNRSSHTPQISKRQTEEKIISGSFDPSRQKSNEEWKKILTPEQYHILREEGTEIPFTGALLHESRKGTYVSVGCNKPLFRSEQKFDSGTGWPSFWDTIHKTAVVLREDTRIPGESRIEVLDTCGGHLGHVFDDGPKPTGKRYCMNSEALIFIPDEK